MIQQIFFLAKHVATYVALMLDFPCVDGDMFFEAVETGEFAFTNRTHEESPFTIGIVGGSDLLVGVSLDMAFKALSSTVNETANVALMLLLQLVNLFVFFVELFQFECSGTLATGEICVHL